MSLFAVLALGFLFGMRHSTDSDHVVAVSTIVSGERRAHAAAIVGALWGVGHTLTILLVGGAIIVFGLVVPVRLGLTLEMAVAVMLVVLGVLNVRGNGLWMSKLAHADDARGDQGQRAAWPSAAVIKPFTIGVVHGLSGSAAIALLVLSTIREPGFAFLYLAVFGAGTVAGMMLLTMTMVVPISLLTRRFGPLQGTIARATGLLSVALGLLLAYRVGFVNGLLTAHPHWIPK